jgi:phage shock protein PspC (stress-responsive transcriptional regulator)
LKHEHSNRGRQVRHRYRPARNQPTAPLRRRQDAGRGGGGIARYLNADVTLVRVIIAALVLVTGVGAALYLTAWLLIPADGDDQSVAAAWPHQLRGRGRLG